MKVLSINVGRSREIEWNGEIVRTSICKAPVAGPVGVHEANLAGDEQSDLTVHGGLRKAVYAYPSEHYAYWREQLGLAELTPGAFGENLTTVGLSEDTVHVGDALVIGSAEFIITLPRMPCYKLTIRFGRGDMIKRFVKSGRSGFYLSVSRQGVIATDDSIALLPQNPRGARIQEIFRNKTRKA